MASPQGSARLAPHLRSVSAALKGSSFTAHNARSLMRAPPSISTAAHANCPSRRASSRGSTLLHKFSIGSTSEELGILWWRCDENRPRHCPRAVGSHIPWTSQLRPQKLCGENEQLCPHSASQPIDRLQSALSGPRRGLLMHVQHRGLHNAHAAVLHCSLLARDEW